jgi:hypothetical protein
MFGAHPIQHITEYHHIFSIMVVAASCYVYACHWHGAREFFTIQINGIELSTGKILEGNLVQSVFNQTLGDEFTFQQDNNVKHKAKSTLELVTKTTWNVPEWPSYSLDLNLARLENSCLALINNQLDRA